MTEQYSFSYMLNKETYRRLKQALLPSKKNTVFTVCICVILISFCYKIVQEIKNGIHWYSIAYVAAVFFCIMWLAAYRKAAYGGYAKYAKKYLGAVPSVSVTFGDNIRISSGEKNTEYNYSQLGNIYESEEAFYLSVFDDTLYLPKTALSGGDIMDFRLFIMPKQHCKASKTPANNITVLSIICIVLIILCFAAERNNDWQRSSDMTPDNIIAHYYDDTYGALYQYEIPNGFITFLYDSEKETVACCTTVKKGLYSRFERGPEYELKYFADYNENVKNLYWSKAISFSDGTLSYGWIYADSALKKQIADENLQSAAFVAGDESYIIYFKEKAGEE